MSSRRQRWKPAPDVTVRVAAAAILVISTFIGTAIATIASHPEPIRDVSGASSQDGDFIVPDDLDPSLNFTAVAPEDFGFDDSPTERSGQPDGSAPQSVRQRGGEAPVELKREEPVRPERPEQPAASAQDPRPDHPEVRLWPLRDGDYLFTQQFGCVPQLGNLYFAGEGCPASAPVIHTGIDLAAPEGTPFFAAASGWVTLAGFDRPTPDANTRIIIQHDGRNEHFATEYLHWIAAYVEEGDYVHAGDPIGEVGSVGYSTGPHLHFSVTDLRTGEHIDPMRWLPENTESGGFRGQRPDARFRLPAGTTAGHPESADPAPPSPPKRQDVPESPLDGGNQERADRQLEREREREREARREANRESSSAPEAEAVDQSDPADPPNATKDDETDSQTRERTRERDREKNGDETTSASSGSDRDQSGGDGDNRNQDDKGGGNADGRNNDNTNSHDKPRDRQHENNDAKDNGDDDGKGSGGKDGDNGADGDDGANGSDGQNGGSGQDGGNGGNGQNGEDGGDGSDGTDGGSGGSGGNGGDGGNGGNGGDGGAGENGGDGGQGGDAGDGGQGGDGGDGGDAESGAAGNGGDGGASGGAATGGNGGDGGAGGSDVATESTQDRQNNKGKD